MRIEIWSDVVCPWCYIGKRRLETALAGFPHRDEVEVVYRSFELDPSAPQVGHETIAEALGRKYGGGAAAGRQMMARVAEVAADEGLTFAYDEATHTKTVDAHRLLHLALSVGRQHELKEALLAAYFTRGESMGDHDVLRKAAVAAGLEPGRVDEVLAGDEFAADVRADVDQARAFGATGVPFFVVDRKFGVSGAQPAEVFTQLLERAWSESHPAISVLADGETCGPDGCEVPS
ncbi:DsbA family oxidoreductase [Actinokineospora sp. HUAS TT18]|uniref:DsbA family oxidoreductase n=1 Tax=Actinokineospora sp. HUAS TT18 TaxID=3447451 RepID=UPI003F51D00A